MVIEITEDQLRIAWNTLHQDYSDQIYNTITLFHIEESDNTFTDIEIVLAKYKDYAEFKLVYNLDNQASEIIFICDISAHKNYDSFVTTLSKALTNNTCLRRIKKANENCFLKNKDISIITYKNKIENGIVVYNDK